MALIEDDYNTSSGDDAVGAAVEALVPVMVNRKKGLV